ncbi:MAG TPA: DUF4080 domain-containing protein [Candidatus Cloacimonadota bacterium]|nr:DUF4080 domain-containing protein [Candidatus Cloacimonadota bacterium]
MMKIAFVAINSSWSHSSLALYYMRAMLEPELYETVMLDYTTRDLPEDVLELIYQQAPDVLCFSVYIWNRIYLQDLLPAVQKVLPNSVLVIGGPEVENLVSNTKLSKYNYFIEGPGEAAFRKLDDEYFEGDYGFVSVRTHIPLKDIPFPYQEEDKARLEGKLIYYETSRGCPFKCIYCLSANDPRSEQRFNAVLPGDLVKLYQELDALFYLQPKTLKFVDRSFNTDKALANRIWKYVIKHDEAPVCHFEIYPDLLTNDDLEILKTAPENRIRFEVGIQSVHPEILQASGRRSDWPKAKAMLLRLKNETRLIVHSDLLIGLPGDSMAGVLHSLDELMQTEPAELQLGILKILPDTPMCEQATKLGYEWWTIPPYRIISSDALSFEEVNYLDHLAHIINLYYNKGEFYPQWHHILQSEAASVAFGKLLDYHLQHELPLHSLQKTKRKAVFDSIFPGTAENL